MPSLVAQPRPKGDILIEFTWGHSHGVATITPPPPCLLAGNRLPSVTERGLVPADGERLGHFFMSESYIQNLFAERIGGRQYGKSTAIYKFEKIKRAKRAAMAAHPGKEIIDMGVN